MKTLQQTNYYRAFQPLGPLWVMPMVGLFRVINCFDENNSAGGVSYIHNDIKDDNASLLSAKKRPSDDNNNDTTNYIGIDSNKTSSLEQQQLQQKQKDNEIVTRHSHEKSDWMPDQACKYCYEYGDKFTVFQRRHHCRLCGQAFYNNCSSYFAEIEILDN
mmetsp:Transcript_17869/g.27612  ORF Transcript_17869/g.27612 Transcript_17869/m.27612 type:complete len:160 (+) Transcript_17869:384-863(+)